MNAKITRKTLAEEAGVCERTMRRWIKRMEFKPIFPRLLMPKEADYLRSQLNINTQA
jgi:hypothetical protein